MKNIVIIGSGLGGLSCGAALSKAGHNVTVIEKHVIPGGCATNFRRKTSTGDIVTFDVSLHGTGNLNEGRDFYETLKNIGVFDKLKPLRKTENATLYYKNEEGFDIPDSFEEYKNTLINKFPEEKQNIENLFNFIKELDDDMENNVYKGGVPKYFNELQQISLEDFLKKYTKNEDLIEIFGFLWGYYGLPPSKLNALYYLLAWVSYHIGGTYYLEGGGGNFSDSFVEIIKENNGKVILKQEVIKINTNQNTIVSVETSTGDVYEGDIFVINGCPANVLKTVDNQEIIKDYLDKINSLPPSNSLGHMYIALDCPPQDLGVKKADEFFNYCNHDESYQYSLDGNFEKIPFCLVNYNLLDPNLNKNSGFLALTYVDFIKNWPEYGTEEYKKQKEEVQEIFLQRIYQIYPEVKDRITKIEFATPHTMKRYTNNIKGAIYGFDQNVGNGGFDRLSMKTSLDNAFIASAWTQPGGGYEGAIRAGLFCSDLINKKLATNNSKNDTNIQEEITMSPNVFMKGMLYQINKEYAKDLEVNYKFNFTDVNKQYFVKVHKGKATLENNLENIDATINCTYKTWVDISNNVIDGEEAFREGSLKVEGDLNSFMHIPSLFSTKKETKKPRKLFKGQLLIPLALVPWIFYWISDNLLSPVLIGFFGILFPLALSNMKPKFCREVTILESITILFFTFYLMFKVVYPTQNYVYFELIFPIALLVSCFFEPLTAQYSKWEYPDSMVNTKLFKVINVNICLVWTVVYLVQFLIVKILFGNMSYSIVYSPFANLAYLGNIIVILFAAIYPKIMMK